MLKDYLGIWKAALLIIAAALIPVLIWYLFDVILIAFGAVILAILLRLGAQPLMRWLSLPESAALALSGLLILVVLSGAAYLFGTTIGNEFQDVAQRATSASVNIQGMLKSTQFGRFLLDHVGTGTLSVTSLLSNFLKVSANFLEGLIVMVVSGIYLAAQPRIYREGLVWLFPPRQHHRAAEIIEGIGEALRLWLLGQLIEMMLIGMLVGLAAWLLGVPSPFALALIAGIAEFIPYLGPLLAAIPAILVALTKSPQTALWILLAYLIIHQIEGQIIAPIIQRRMVSIPPAVLLLGIAALTYLFGGIAIIFAAPIAVVVFAAVNLLYVRDMLGEKTELTRKLG
jgi:predicted PurR-regulated permease PerM